MGESITGSTNKGDRLILIKKLLFGKNYQMAHRLEKKKGETGELDLSSILLL